MKLNRYLITAGLAGLLFASCENEFNKEVELGVNVATNEAVGFDGQTITVKKGTPVEFRFSGDPDFLTFFSGEAGKEYKNRERITADAEEIASSHLKFSIQTQYGDLKGIDFRIKVSETFGGLYGNDFEADSVLVEQHEGWTDLITTADLGEKTNTTTDFDLDFSAYLGKRIAIAMMYKGLSNVKAQTKIFVKNMQVENEMKNGTSASLAAASLGFKPLNMMNKWNLADQSGLASVTGDKEYGSTNSKKPNIAGIWNLDDMTNFYIHSSNEGAQLKYSWLVSNLFVSNACTPDSGTELKNITERLDSYKYTYNEAGTYTATFVARNANQNGESATIQEYTVVVTE